MYTLKVFRAFQAIKLVWLSQTSLHYEGRALDVALRRNKRDEVSTDAWARTEEYKSLIQKLGRKAYDEAKFSFVSITTGVHGEHLHLSCKR